MIPLSWLSNAWHHYFAGSGVCVCCCSGWQSTLPAIITHTPVPASVHPADWHRCCLQIGCQCAVKLMHTPPSTIVIFQLNCKTSSHSLSLCVFVIHTYLHTHSHTLVHQSATERCCLFHICPFVSGTSLWFQAQHCNDDVCTRSLIPSSASLLLLSRVSL